MEERFYKMVGRNVIHFKEFTKDGEKMIYNVIGISEHTETGEKLVVYKALYGEGKLYVRPYQMFMSEVDTKKYPNAKQKYRLQLYV